MGYALKRFLQLIPILFGITFLSFLLMYLAGSDAVTEMYANRGVEVAQEIIDQKKASLGLDLPFWQQYGNWLLGMLQGDMGHSYVTGEEVFSAFLRKLPATMLLTGLSLLLTVAVSLPCGIWAAVHRDRVSDLLLRFASFLGNAMPNFFVAMVLMDILGIELGLLPVISSNMDLKSALLPTLTLSVAMSAKYLRQVRSAVLGNLLGGTAIIESIFMWDGVGKLAVDAINMRDYPVIQAYVMWMAMIYVGVNLLADLLYHYLDPRIRLGVSGK